MSEEDLQESASADDTLPLEDFDDLCEMLEDKSPIDIDPFGLSIARQQTFEVEGLTLSQFTQLAFRMPRTDGGAGHVPFSFVERPHMRRPYDTSAKRILLVCARQVEKSTMLGNRIIAMSCMVPNFRSLYVSPTATQTKTFSDDRLNEPIQTSEVLRAFTSRAMMMNIFEKQFSNWAKIVLRNSYLNADRCRGIPAWQLLIDEFQDILSENVPVIEQCTSHAPEQWKSFVYAGTPKTLDNPIEHYRSGYSKDGKALSTQSEWMVPCDSCGTADSYRYWNILGEANIGKTCLICDRCGARIFPQHPDAQWAHKVEPENAIAESYRISQLMVPWKKWDEILLDQSRYPRAQFFNEVLGLSYDHGLRPISMADVQQACVPDLRFLDEANIEKFKHWDSPIFAGLDHGTGENTYTVLVLGTYIRSRFTIFYAHRFIGPELELELQMKLIIEKLKAFRVLIIGSDYGGGFHQNDRLTRTFGPERVAKFQYAGKAKRKVEYSKNLRRFIVFRSEVMTDILMALKRGKIGLPCFEEFREPYGQDMCNITAEYNERLRLIQYDNGGNNPDDTFHAILYCFLASMIKEKRPDIIAPLREGPSGDTLNPYSGPVSQDYYPTLLQQREDGLVDGVECCVGHKPRGSASAVLSPACQVGFPSQLVAPRLQHEPGGAHLGGVQLVSVVQ